MGPYPRYNLRRAKNGAGSRASGPRIHQKVGENKDTWEQTRCKYWQSPQDVTDNSTIQTKCSPEKTIYGTRLAGLSSILI